MIVQPVVEPMDHFTALVLGPGAQQLPEQLGQPGDEVGVVPGAEPVEVLEIEQHDLARVRGQPAPHRAQDGGDLGAAEAVEDAVVGTGGDQQPDVEISEEKENIKEVKVDDEQRAKPT